MGFSAPHSLSVGPWASLIAFVPELCHYSNGDVRAHSSEVLVPLELQGPFKTTVIVIAFSCGVRTCGWGFLRPRGQSALQLLLEPGAPA